MLFNKTSGALIGFTAMATAESRSLGIPDLLIRECCRCSFSLKPKQSPFVLTQLRNCPASIFAFPPSFSHDDWAPPVVHDLSLFPLLRSIGANLPAILHAPFLRRFLHLLSTSLLECQVLITCLPLPIALYTSTSLCRLFPSI